MSLPCKSVLTSNEVRLCSDVKTGSDKDATEGLNVNAGTQKIGRELVVDAVKTVTLAGVSVAFNAGTNGVTMEETDGLYRKSGLFNSFNL